MIHLEDIHSLTDFARNTKAYGKKLKKTGRPVVLTVNGRAEFIVQDAQTYQHLLNMADYTEEMIKLERSLSDVEAGRVHDFRKIADQLKTKYLGTVQKGTV